MARERPEHIDTEEFESFNSLEEAIQERRQAYFDYMKRVAAENQKNQEAMMKRMVSNYLATLKEGEMASAADVERIKKQFEADRRAKERQQIAQDIEWRYKKELDKSMPSRRKQQHQEAIDKLEINQAMLEIYKQKGEENLSDQEKADKKAREAQVLEGKKWKAINQVVDITKQLLNSVNQGISTYTKYQSAINTRLQGASLGFNASNPIDLAYALRNPYGITNKFGFLENRLSTAIGIQPYIKSAVLTENLSKLVEAGIASNLEQRAFLQTVKDNVANTFDAANSSLLRIVRLQQQDSTAARLGMEGYLTQFLNELVQNTEYLNQTFDSVQEALLEASSQMTMRASTEFEYVVQKWLGALTGTGLSESTASNIAQALGYLGSGNISALSSSSMMNLISMAASRGGLDIGTLLNEGLNATTANQLIRAIVNYMIEIGGNESNVVRSQLAQAFGLSVSDITAAQQLSGSLGQVYGNMLSYGGMYTALNQELMAIPGRMSVGEMLQNNFDNMMFSLAKGVAENPGLMALWQIADMVQSTTGGIPIPTVGVLGNFASLNATVEQLVKMGIVGVSSFNWIGEMLSGLSSTLVPSSMLWKLGILSGNTAISRGGGLSGSVSGLTTSQSTYIGTGSGADMYSQTLESSYNEAKSNKTIQPESDDRTTEALPNIYDYLTKTLDGYMKVLESKVTSIESMLANGEVEVKNTTASGTLIF